MKTSAWQLLMLLLLLAYLGVAVSGCRSSRGVPGDIYDIMSRPTELRFAANEVRDYQGVRLDPSIGPRDNSIKGIQHVDIESYRLRISGEVLETRILSYDEVLAYPAHQRLVTLHCVEGWSATVLWKGVRLVELLDFAGLGQNARIVIFHCQDGYTTSMPVATIRERDMLLAYSSNGIILPASLGYPFIIVAEDKLGYKWARWVIGMEISSDVDFQGFWENEGFDNDADIGP